MSFGVIDRFLKEKAVYWAAPTSDGRGGFQTSAPVEISCRWTLSKAKAGTLNAASPTSDNQTEPSVTVMTDRDVEVDGYLWKGLLATLVTAKTMDPMGISDALKIKKFTKVPTPKADKFFRVAVI